MRHSCHPADWRERARNPDHFGTELSVLREGMDGVRSTRTANER